MADRSPTSSPGRKVTGKCSAWRWNRQDHTPAERFNRRCFPTWSRNGKWIYFSSNRGQSNLQLYHMPAGGGPVTLVANRSVVAHESPDGRWLYFAEWPVGTLYRMPLRGGAIVPVIQRIGQASRYALSKDGLPSRRHLSTGAERSRLASFGEGVLQSANQ